MGSRARGSGTQSHMERVGRVAGTRRAGTVCARESGGSGPGAYRKGERGFRCTCGGEATRGDILLAQSESCFAGAVVRAGGYARRWADGVDIIPEHARIANLVRENLWAARG